MPSIPQRAACNELLKVIPKADRVRRGLLLVRFEWIIMQCLLLLLLLFADKYNSRQQSAPAPAPRDVQFPHVRFQLSVCVNCPRRLPFLGFSI